MGRYDIREKSKKISSISTDKYNLEFIKEDIALLHYYDTKLGENSKYEVYDNKFKKVVWEEQ